jgi:hypothetical protein
MLEEKLPMGAWSDEMPPINLHNYALKNTAQEKPPSSGSKYDNDKPRMDLLDPDWLEGVADVLTFGAQKYAAHNWRGGIVYSRLIAAAYRHLGAINRGEDIDPESGKPHAYHLSCCVMFLSWMMKNRKDLDDRYKTT